MYYFPNPTIGEDLDSTSRSFPCCYAPPRDAPDVSPLPSASNGYITFGSLHKLEKLNDTVIDTWAELLKAVPSSRLLLCRHVLNGRTAEWMRARFVERGIEPSRLTLRTTEPARLEHLRVYEQIDIALDPWPWNGHTTACEALWMGVPTIALRGERHASRMVASVLTCVGLRDWTAETREEYIGLAARWAAAAELAELRSGLREQVRRSPLCAAPAFCQELDSAYHAMCEPGL